MLSLFARNDASRPLIEGPDHIRSLPSEPPLFDPHPRSTVALLAQSMNQLSMKEREKVLEEIHGVADILEEEPQFVEQCLVELEDELHIVPNKDAYETARSRSMDYVSNRKFRLQFLRADSFNVRHAAVRIVAYFEAKLELFGLEKLTKCITQRDLDQDDLACLESGISQLLPVRDTTGRAILCVLPSYTPWRMKKPRNVELWDCVAMWENRDLGPTVPPRGKMCAMSAFIQSGSWRAIFVLTIQKWKSL
jgi:hypothetical protein